MRYYIVICAKLYIGFSSKSKANNAFPKPLLKPKACIQSIQTSNRFCHVIVKVFDQNQKHMEMRNQRTDTPVEFTVL